MPHFDALKIYIFMIRVLCYLLYSVKYMLRTGASHCSINRGCGSILVIRRLDYTLFMTAYNPPVLFLGGITSLLNTFIYCFLCISYIKRLIHIEKYTSITMRSLGRYTYFRLLLFIIP